MQTKAKKIKRRRREVKKWKGMEEGKWGKTPHHPPPAHTKKWGFTLFFPGEVKLKNGKVGNEIKRRTL